MMRKDGRSILRVLAHHGIGVAVALGIMGAVAGAQAATVKIKPDEVKVVRLSERPSTVVVGNPLYADVMVVGNQILVQGQNYGKTSVIVMNNEGRKIARLEVVVSGQPEETIAIFRQGKKETFICNPDCNSFLDTSDNAESMSLNAMRLRLRQKLIEESLKR